MDALELIRNARIYDLAQPLEASSPTSPNHPPFRMALLRRHGDVVREDGSSGANELISMGGHAGTHIDALCHVSHNGRLFGGIDARSASDGGRFRALGIETVSPIVTRGVLLDMPRALGLESIPPGTPFSAAELEQASRRLDREIGKGDAVLIRTGWPVGRYSDAAAYAGWSTGVPGPDASGASWLADRGVVAAGSDTLAFEQIPPGEGHAKLPVHVILLVERGIPILESLYLEELAQADAREFLFVAAPLKLVGATGSPARPLAIVAQ